VNGDGIPPSDKSMRELQEKSRKELEAILGVQKLVTDSGAPRIWLVALIVGFTVILILFAYFVNKLWWIPACIFIFVLVMWLVVFLKTRQQGKTGV
jgi:Flp pilus assembly protein TadB